MIRNTIVIPPYASHQGRRNDRRLKAVLLSVVLLAACHRSATSDAYGNFEATEVVVASQTTGQLLSFTLNEGDRVAAGALVAVVDTAQLALQRQQLIAQSAATGSRATEVSRQADVFAVQRDVARRSYERIKRLFDEKAATAQQLDQAERDSKTLDAQIAATHAQREGVALDVAATQAQVAQIADRIAKSRVTNPTTGTVLTTYAKGGEVVQPGQPLYKIANLDTLILRAYVTGTQLAAVHLGQRVRVNVDAGNGSVAALPGTVSWVSSKAEFTPTPVQTRAERADLVYAVKILVANPRGTLKIGMPADLDLHPAGQS